MSLETTSIEAPVLFLPVFGAAVNFESVILIPFWASDASLVRMRSRELRLWWSDGVHKREVNDRGEMNRRSHESADIHAHESEERRDVDKRARVEYVLVHRLRQRDAETSITVETYSDKFRNREYTVEKVRTTCWRRESVNEQSKSPASNGK